jgi:hypothetical protein
MALTNYVINFGSNFTSELGTLLTLNVEISNSLAKTPLKPLLLKDGSTLPQNIDYSLINNAKIILYLSGNLPEEYVVKKICYTNKATYATAPTDLTKWSTAKVASINSPFEIDKNIIITGELYVVVILEKTTVKAPTIVLTNPNKKIDIKVKDSDLEKELIIKFTKPNTDYVTVYLSPNRIVKTEDTFVTLYFKKDFDGILGNKKIFLVPSSAAYGDGVPVELIINWIAEVDTPSMVEIDIVDTIDVPSFSNLDINFEIEYKTKHTTTVDIFLLAKDLTKLPLVQNQAPNGKLKLNLRTLATSYPKWNGNTDLTLVFKPYNKGGQKVLEGTEISATTKIIYPNISLDTEKIKKSIYDGFLNKLDFVFDKEDKYLTHIANFGNDEQIIISSWEEDDFTLSKKSEDEFGNTIVKPEDIVESTILKLYNPLPASINENTTLWISKLLTNPLIETIVLSEQDDIKCPPIKGPNFSVEVDFVVGQSTNYESLDNLILSASVSSSSQLVATYLSSSLIKTDDLNIQYANVNFTSSHSGSEMSGPGEYLWNNFVHFSSAKERVDNFIYKVQLIEKYELLYSKTYSTGSTGDGLHTGSLSAVQERERVQLKKNQLINGFDGFEKFLYNKSEYTTNNSSSLTWPYNGDRLTSNDTIVSNWYDNIIELANQFDKTNVNWVQNNIPQYVVTNGNNESMLLFLSMIGHHFDTLYFYTKSIENSRGLGYKSKNTINDKLLFDILKSMGWDAKNLAADTKLWDYVFGQNADGSQRYISYDENGDEIKSKSAKQRTYEVWRRIVNNLPYLLKNKGTRRGIYALMSCYGIPASNLSILEFGGPEITTNTKSKLVMDNVTSALKMVSGSLIQMEWKNTDKNRKPNTIELFVKPSYSKNWTILSGSNWDVKISGSVNSNYGKVIFNYSGSISMSTSLLPIFNDRFFGLSVSSGSNGLKLDVRQAEKERTIFEESITASAYTDWNNGSTLYLGNDFVGSVDEFRLWSEVLDTERFYEHVSFPEMINGNSITSSTTDLYFRLDFEYPKNLATNTKLINVDTNVYFSASLNRNNFENGLNIITGSISNITIINGGTGYTSSLGTSNGSIPLYFVGGEFKQTQPSVTGSLTNGVLTSISISHGGTGMVSFPTNLQPSASLSQSINNSITPIVIELTGSVANFLSENITPLLFATASGFPPITSYPYQFEAIDRSVTLEIPDLGASRYSTNKVRFESQYNLDGTEITPTKGVNLSVNSRGTKKSFDQSPIDSNRVGLFFSPTKELNIDIAKSFGGINLDNYIGNPQDYYKSNYSQLDSLRNYYFQRFDGRDIYAYINLIKLYEKSMFEDIKKMLPARVKATTGLLIEPHILERSKVAHKKPTGVNNQLETIIDSNNTTNIFAETNQYQTIIDANLSDNIFAENYQYNTRIDINNENQISADNYQYNTTIRTTDNTNISSDYYQQTASIDCGLQNPTILTEIDLYDLNIVAGQTTFETVGFGIYAQNGHAIRTYFDEKGRRVKERIKVDLITEQKSREALKYKIVINGKGDPRGGMELTSSIYYETKLNIQPYSTAKVINAGTGSIVQVKKVDGYLPTHYRNTSDLTRGLQNSFFRGSKNTAATTIDGASPIETFISNPNILTVNKAGRNTSEPILEVE